MTPERSLNRLMAQVVGTLVGLALLYVLSTGPAEYLARKVPRIYDAVGAFYTPLDWLADRVGVPAVYRDYLDWWIQLAGPKPPLRSPG